jgi:hypothetical protein
MSGYRIASLPVAGSTHYRALIVKTEEKETRELARVR